LPNLKSNTTYHFQVASVGSTTATTADDTFKTVSVTSTVNRAIGPTLFAPVLTDGDAPTMFFTGVAKGNQTLRVYIDGQLVKTFRTKGTAGQTKVISFTIDTAGLKSGSHSLYVQSTDEFGRTSIIRQTIKFTTGSTGLAAPTLRLNTTSTYVVQPGDSLWSISQTFLGDGSRYAEIVELNVDTLPTLSHSAQVIQPGWTLQLPQGR
ncbi:MAG: LysM peptidoglycan-binding domain-containing protein, partial [Candidatus Kerfeldbacteria bacterium]|nr:LysM peptidoglycan-binding domain-containing protein [Candidatus Kerfeldbacteria bacterium]